MNKKQILPLKKPILVWYKASGRMRPVRIEWARNMLRKIMFSQHLPQLCTERKRVRAEEERRREKKRQRLRGTELKNIKKERIKKTRTWERGRREFEIERKKKKTRDYKERDGGKENAREIEKKRDGNRRKKEEDQRLRKREEEEDGNKKRLRKRKRKRRRRRTEIQRS